MNTKYQIKLLYTYSTTFKPGQCIIVDKHFIYEAVKSELSGFDRLGILRPYEISEFLTKMRENWNLYIRYILEKDHYVIEKLEVK